jgi:hypothetical protein
MTNDRAMSSFVTLDSAAGRASRAVCVLLATFSVLSIPFAAFSLMFRCARFHSDAPGLFGGTFGFLQQQLTDLLARQLPDDAFHLQIKKVSQNVAGIQPTVFDEVVNMTWLLGAQYGIKPFLCWG